MSLLCITLITGVKSQSSIIYKAPAGLPSSPVFYNSTPDSTLSSHTGSGSDL